MFHEVMVKDEIVADGSQAQVQDRSPEVCQHQEAEDLPQGPVLGPRGGVHIWSEDVIISDVQHKVHDEIWKQKKVKKVWNITLGCNITLLYSFYVVLGSTIPSN